MDGMVYYIVNENYPYEIKLMKIWKIKAITH